jgi:RNA polymerase sigma-70 factor, ECF subfamily
LHSLHLLDMSNPASKYFIDGINRHDNKVFRELFDTYYQQMARFACYFLFDEDEAQDQVQDTFADLWNKAGKLEHITDLKAYLFTQVKNRCLNRIRHLNIVDKNREWIVEAITYAEIPDVDFDAELHSKVIKLIETLPDQTRNVFKMCVMEGLKYREAAKILGITENTINTHIKRAYKSLRQKLNIPHLVFLLFIWDCFRNS